MTRLLCAATLAAILAACGGGTTTTTTVQPDAGSDSTAPAAVTDLAAAQASITTTGVSLTFTATGDDGNTGTAAQYDLRFASTGCPLTGATFSSATQVPSVAAPRAAGTAETVTVSGLSPGTSYCFALRAADEAGNVSPLSNVATAHTLTSGPTAPQLALGKDSNGAQIITWTASDDDGRAGALASEELRLATGALCPLTPATFTGGSVVAGPSIPLAAGGIENVNWVNLLDPNVDACAMLEVKDAQGQAAFSNSLAFHSPGTAPAKPVLGGFSASPFQLVVNWLATGNDGRIGTVASQALAYESGAACASFSSANFAGGTNVALAAPPVAGTEVDVTVTGLQPVTTYCFLLRVQDHEGNVVFSDLFTIPTAPATQPPETPVLTARDVTAHSLTLSWEAPAARGPNGDTAAAAYVLTYTTGPGCSSATTHVTTGAPKAPGTAEQADIAGLSAHAKVCFVLETDDAFGNSSLASLNVETVDTLPPAVVSDLIGGPAGASGIFIQFTATGDDGNTGTAANYTWAIGGPLASCPATEAELISPVILTSPDPLPVPSAAGTRETLTVDGLQPGANYCVALSVQDAAGNDSGFSPVVAAQTPTPPPAAVTDLRATFLGGPLLRRNVSLDWTAPAAFGGKSVVSYLIFWEDLPAGQACALSLDNLSSAKFIIVPGAATPGSHESNRAQLLIDHADDDLCFAIVADDARGGQSALSNLSRPPRPPFSGESLFVEEDNAELVVSVNPTFQGQKFEVDLKVAYAFQGSGNCPALGGDLVFSPGVVFTDIGLNGVVILKNLVPGISYCAAFLATDNGGDAVWSDILSFSTIAVPSAPTNLSFISATRNSLTVEFGAAFENATLQEGVALQYLVFYQAGHSCTFDSGFGLSIDATGIVTAAGDPIRAVLTTLVAPGTEYCIQAGAVDARNVVGPRSNTVLGSTLARLTTPPSAITDLHAEMISQSTAGGHSSEVVRLRWTAPGDAAGQPVARYVLFRSVTGAACPITPATLASLQPIPQAIVPAQPGTQQFFDANLAVSDLNDGLCFEMSSGDTSGNSSATSNIAWSLPRVGSLQEIPSLATATSAVVAFDPPIVPPGSEPLRYVLAYAAGSACQNLQGGEIGDSPGLIFDEGPVGPGSIVMTGLSPDGTFCTAVGVTDATGDRTWSAFAIPVHTAGAEAPPPPANVTLIGATATSLSVSFDSSPASFRPGTGVALTYFVITKALADCSRFGLEESGTLTFAYENGLVSAAGQPIQAEVHGLTPGTHYCLAVGARNDAGQVAGPSPVIEASTTQTVPLTRPTAVFDLHAGIDADSVAPSSGLANQQEVNLIWTAPSDIDGGTVASYTTYFAKNQGCPITSDNLAGATIFTRQPFPVPPGTLVFNTLQVPAVDADSLCFAITATGSGGAVSALSNVALPPHVIDNLTVQPGDTSALLIVPAQVPRPGTGALFPLASVVAAPQPCPLNSPQPTSGVQLVQAVNGQALFVGLLPGTSYCAGVSLSDNLQDSATSLSIGFTTTGTTP